MNDALLLEDPFRHASTGALFAPLSSLFRLISSTGQKNSVVLGEQARAKAKFYELTARWKAETSHLSSVTDMMSSPSFKGIVSMGVAAIPLLLRQLECDPYHWFIALHAITDANPVPQDAAGDFDRMTQAWLDWGRAQGYRF